VVVVVVVVYAQFHLSSRLTLCGVVWCGVVCCRLKVNGGGVLRAHYFVSSANAEYRRRTYTLRHAPASTACSAPASPALMLVHYLVGTGGSTHRAKSRRAELPPPAPARPRPRPRPFCLCLCRYLCFCCACACACAASVRHRLLPAVIRPCAFAFAFAFGLLRCGRGYGYGYGCGCSAHGSAA
jgi:hypothetical protein